VGVIGDPGGMPPTEPAAKPKASAKAGGTRETTYVILERVAEGEPAAVEVEDGDAVRRWREHPRVTAAGQDAAKSAAFAAIFAARVGKLALADVQVGELVAVPVASWQPEAYEAAVRGRRKPSAPATDG
jgi:hypothetical protein